MESRPDDLQLTPDEGFQVFLSEQMIQMMFLLIGN